MKRILGHCAILPGELGKRWGGLHQKLRRPLTAPHLHPQPVALLAPYPLALPLGTWQLLPLHAVIRDACVCVCGGVGGASRRPGRGGCSTPRPRLGSTLSTLQVPLHPMACLMDLETAMPQLPDAAGLTLSECCIPSPAAGPEPAQRRRQHASPAQRWRRKQDQHTPAPRSTW